MEDGLRMRENLVKRFVSSANDFLRDYQTDYGYYQNDKITYKGREELMRRACAFSQYIDRSLLSEIERIILDRLSLTERNGLVGYDTRSKATEYIYYLFRNSKELKQSDIEQIVSTELIYGGCLDL